MDRMDMKVCKARNSRDEGEGWKDKSGSDNDWHQTIDTIILSLFQK